MSTMMTGYLKKLQIIFIFIVLSSAIYLPAVIMIRSGEQKQPTDYNDPLLYICVIVTTAGVISANLIYRLRLPSVRQKATTEEKLAAWRALLIITVAMIEAVTVMSVIFLFFTGYDIFLYIAIALIALQFMNFPTRRRVQSDLGLDEDEANAL